MKYLCDVKGCNKVYHGLGLCQMHYRRLKRTGNIYPKGDFRNSYVKKPAKDWRIKL